MKIKLTSAKTTVFGDIKTSLLLDMSLKSIFYFAKWNIGLLLGLKNKQKNFLTYHPLKGEQVNSNPPTSSAMLLIAGTAYHSKPNAANFG